MALIALLSARDGARERTAAGVAGALIEFGGQPLIEFQARMAINAGVEHVLIQVDSIGSDLARLVDRLTSERHASIALVQNMETLSRNLVPDDRLILIAENLIMPAEAIASLVDAQAPALMTLPVVPATTGFERIDGKMVWAGGVSVTGSMVLDTIDMLGDWDLGLTLLRRAVQDGAKCITLSPELVMEGRLTQVRDQESADVALHALADQGSSTQGKQGNGGFGGLLALFARPIVRELVRRQIEPSLLSSLSLAFGAAGLALGVGGWSILAVLVMLLALGVSDIARQCADITLRSSGPSWRRWLVPALALALLAYIGWRLSGGEIMALSGAWLPLFLTGILSFLPSRSDPISRIWSPWLRLSVPIALTVILLGLVLAMPGAAFALLGVAAAAIITVRFLSENDTV